MRRIRLRQLVHSKARTTNDRVHPRRLPDGGEPRPARRPAPARPTPIQGVHPPGADVSALGHLFGESATVDPSRGVSLDQTRRIHPDIWGVHDGAVLRGAAPPPTGTPPADGGGAGAAGRARPALHSRPRPRRPNASRRYPRAVGRRRGLGRPGGRSEAADAPGRPGRGPLQRPRRGPAVHAACRRPGGHGRQVPGAGGADHDLLDGHLDRRRSAARGWRSSTACTASTSPPPRHRWGGRQRLALPETRGPAGAARSPPSAAAGPDVVHLYQASSPIENRRGTPGAVAVGPLALVDIPLTGPLLSSFMSAPAIADGHRLGSRPPAATALIQYRRHRRVLGDNRGLQFHVAPA